MFQTPKSLKVCDALAGLELQASPSFFLLGILLDMVRIRKHGSSMPACRQGAHDFVANVVDALQVCLNLLGRRCTVSSCFKHLKA